MDKGIEAQIEAGVDREIHSHVTTIGKAIKREIANHIRSSLIGELPHGIGRIHHDYKHLEIMQAAGLVREEPDSQGYSLTPEAKTFSKGYLELNDAYFTTMREVTESTKASMRAIGESSG